MSAKEVINFWFGEIEPGQRFKKDPDFDEQIRTRFKSLHKKATQGLLYRWRDHPLDALAEIILLDQLAYQIYDQIRILEQYYLKKEFLVLLRSSINGLARLHL